ncbi:MAG: hypothetical protein PVG90_12470 [Bacillota bacterium]
MYVDLEDEELVFSDIGGCFWKKPFWGYYSPSMAHLYTKKFDFEDAATNRVALRNKKLSPSRNAGSDL